jgi:hypothetical protein
MGVSRYIQALSSVSTYQRTCCQSGQIAKAFAMNQASNWWVGVPSAAFLRKYRRPEIPNSPIAT